MSKLKNQAVSGVLWTSIRSVVTVLTGPLLMIVQAQYLTPTEFGVLSVVNVFLSIINVIENFGFSTAVIQREEVTKNEKSSLFFLQTIFAALIGVIVIGTAPLVADVFDMEPLSSLLPLLSIVIFLNGPAILFTAFLEKEFYFKELSIINILRQIVLFLSTTIFLMRDLKLVGVIFGQILSVFVMVVLVLAVAFKNNFIHIKFHFNIAEIKPYIKFGFFIGGKQLMTQVTHHVDELIIGYFLSAEVLGLYFFAKNLLNRMRTLVSTAFSKVLLPLLSKVKNDRPRLTRTYNNISKYVGVFAFPMFIGIALTADLFIPVLFGAEWLDSVNFFVILSIAYIPYMLTANVATSLLYSVNKPNIVLYTDLVANTIYIALLFLVSWLGLGIYSVVGLYAFYLIAKTTALQIISQNHLFSTFIDFLRLFKFPVIATLIMALSVLVTKSLTGNINNLLLELIISIIVGVVSYGLIYILIDKKTLHEIKDLIVNR